MKKKPKREKNMEKNNGPWINSMESTDGKWYFTSLPPPYFTSSRPRLGLSLSSLSKPPSWVVCTLLGKCLFYAKNTFYEPHCQPKLQLTLYSIDWAWNMFVIGARKEFLRSQNLVPRSLPLCGVKAAHVVWGAA